MCEASSSDPAHHPQPCPCAAVGFGWQAEIALRCQSPWATGPDAWDLFRHLPLVATPGVWHLVSVAGWVRVDVPVSAAPVTG